MQEMMQVELPEELERAFLDNIEAKSIFDVLPASHQKTYIRWVAGAKKPETRISRARRCLTMLVETIV